MNKNKTKIKYKAALLSFSIGILMLFLKFSGYLVTDSNIILSDALESIVHVAATSFALYSIIISARPADKSHLYGHKNIEFFSAAIEGSLIIMAAVLIFYTSINDIISGIYIKNLSFGIWFVASAGLINLFLGMYLIKIGKETGSLTLIADGKHILTDSITSLGAFIGIILVLITNNFIFDPIFAMILALNIIYMGYKLIREAVSGLMHETDPQTLNDISQLFINFRKNYWIDIHEMRYWKSGEKIFIDVHLILPYYFTIKESHSEEKEIKEFISNKIPSWDLIIHFDYCNFDLCKFCEFKECKVRKEEFKIKNIWNTDKLIGAPIYKTHSNI